MCSFFHKSGCAQVTNEPTESASVASECTCDVSSSPSIPAPISRTVPLEIDTVACEGDARRRSHPYALCVALCSLWCFAIEAPAGAKPRAANDAQCFES